MDNETVLVNGTLYDAITGRPVETQVNASTIPIESMRPRAIRPSHNVHRQTEVSRAVNRRTSVLSDSTPQAAKSAIITHAQSRRTIQPTATTSPAIARFAPQPSKAINRPRRIIDDIRPAAAHPIAARAEARLQQSTDRFASSAPKPSSLIKKEAITEALDKAPLHKTIKPKRSFRTSRALSFASMALSLLLLTGYLTYINLPNLSVRVAANQAGVDANYPGYRPDGYRLAGVNYDRGSVSLKFAANAGPQKFTITQQQTSWDSTAVKENYVKANWGDDVVPYSERGLTIYAHEGNAAWVNGGILYTITGDAPLSASQVRSIATSL